MTLFSPFRLKFFCPLITSSFLTLSGDPLKAHREETNMLNVAFKQVFLLLLLKIILPVFPTFKSPSRAILYSLSPLSEDLDSDLADGLLLFSLFSAMSLVSFSTFSGRDRFLKLDTLSNFVWGGGESICLVEFLITSLCWLFRCNGLFDSLSFRTVNSSFTSLAVYFISGGDFERCTRSFFIFLDFFSLFCSGAVSGEDKSLAEL